MAPCLRAFLTPPLHQHRPANSFPKTSLKDGSLWTRFLIDTSTQGSPQKCYCPPAKVGASRVNTHKLISDVCFKKKLYEPT